MIGWAVISLLWIWVSSAQDTPINHGHSINKEPTVRNWEFLIQPKEPPPTKDEPPDPRKLLRRRSSLVVDDLPSPKPSLEKRFSYGKAPPKPVFEEPTADSLLDSFGF